MTPDDELERELESLHPRLPSPELRRQVERRLRRRMWMTVVAGGAIAASVVVALVLGRREGPIVIGPLPSYPVAATPAPSVLAYGTAASKSPEALDDLLDKQAVRSGWSEPSVRAMAESLNIRGFHE
jgi:hypothetical protein